MYQTSARGRKLWEVGLQTPKYKEVTSQAICLLNGKSLASLLPLPVFSNLLSNLR